MISLEEEVLMEMFWSTWLVFILVTNPVFLGARLQGQSKSVPVPETKPFPVIHTHRHSIDKSSQCWGKPDAAAAIHRADVVSCIHVLNVIGHRGKSRLNDLFLTQSVLITRDIFPPLTISSRTDSPMTLHF